MDSHHKWPVMWKVYGDRIPLPPTHSWRIVHQNNFFHHRWRWAVKDAMDSPQQGWPSLVVEADDDGSIQPFDVILLGLTAVKLQYEYEYKLFIAWFTVSIFRDIQKKFCFEYFMSRLKRNKDYCRTMRLGLVSIALLCPRGWHAVSPTAAFSQYVFIITVTS